MRENKIFCVHGCFSVSRYIKRGRSLCLVSFDIIAFLDIYVSTTYIYRQNSGIVIFLCKNYMSSYLRYIYRLLDEIFLSLAVISELYEEPRRKYWVSEKVHRKIFVRHITILAASPPFCVIFYCFFVYSLSLSIFSLLRFYVEKIFCSGK